MADITLKTRLLNKFSEGAATSLLKGELNFYKGTDVDGKETILVQVGSDNNQVKTFSVPASDVYAWAKKEKGEATDINYVKDESTVTVKDALDALYDAIELLSGDSGSIADLLTQITALGTQITNETARATKAEADLAAEINAVETTATEAKAAIDAFLKDAKVTGDAIDTLKEIQAQLDAGETSAANLLKEINNLKAIDNATQDELNAAVETINAAIATKADSTTVDGVAGRVSTLEKAVDVEKVSTAIAAAKSEAIADAKTKADTAESNAKAYATELNTAMNTRVATLEAIDHDAYKAADTALHSTISAEIDADVKALADGAVKTNTDAIAAINNATTGVLTTSKAYTDAEVAKDRERIVELEKVDHSHKNLTLLETYTQTEANLADAVSKKHSHSNKADLDGITSAKITAWNSAESNAKAYAKDYADGLAKNYEVAGAAATAKSEAIAAAASDATTKADNAKTAAVNEIKSFYKEGTGIKVAADGTISFDDTVTLILNANA